MSLYQAQNKIEVPYYIKTGSSGTRIIPTDSELFTKKRVILIDDEINNEMMMRTYVGLEYLTDSDEPINFVISSPGGDVTAGRAIYDMMQGCKNKIRTFCIGRAASMAAVLLAAGDKGERYIMPNSEVMIHEVLTKGIGGSATSVSKLCASINEVRDIMNAILAKHTGRTIEEINEATSFDNYMNAQQAIEFGICDSIVTDIFTEVK